MQGVLSKNKTQLQGEDLIGTFLSRGQGIDYTY